MCFEYRSIPGCVLLILCAGVNTVGLSPMFEMDELPSRTETSASMIKHQSIADSSTMLHEQSTTLLQSPQDLQLSTVESTGDDGLPPIGSTWDRGSSSVESTTDGGSTTSLLESRPTLNEKGPTTLDERGSAIDSAMDRGLSSVQSTMEEESSTLESTTVAKGEETCLSMLACIFTEKYGFFCNVPETCVLCTGWGRVNFTNGSKDELYGQTAMEQLMNIKLQCAVRGVVCGVCYRMMSGPCLCTIPTVQPSCGTCVDE